LRREKGAADAAAAAAADAADDDDDNVRAQCGRSSRARRPRRGRRRRAHEREALVAAGARSAKRREALPTDEAPGALREVPQSGLVADGAEQRDQSAESSGRREVVEKSPGDFAPAASPSTGLL